MKSNLDRYLTEAKKFQGVTPQEEIELSKLIKQGDINALHELVTANLALVGLIAEKYRYRKIDFGDVINAGNLGLVKAAWKFDYTKGYKFATYAGAPNGLIHSEIKSAIIEHDTYRIPADRRSRFNKYNRSWERLEQRLCGEPTIIQISKEMKIPVAKAEQTVSDLDATYHESADTTINGSATLTLKDTYADTPNDDIKQQINAILSSSRITPRERLILELYYLHEFDFNQLGIIFNYTGEWVGQLAKKATIKLKESPMVKNIIFTA